MGEKSAGRTFGKSIQVIGYTLSAIGIAMYLLAIFLHYSFQLFMNNFIYCIIVSAIGFMIINLGTNVSVKERALHQECK